MRSAFTGPDIFRCNGPRITRQRLTIRTLTCATRTRCAPVACRAADSSASLSTGSGGSHRAAHTAISCFAGLSGMAGLTRRFTKNDDRFTRGISRSDHHEYNGGNTAAGRIRLHDQPLECRGNVPFGRIRSSTQCRLERLVVGCSGCRKHSNARHQNITSFQVLIGVPSEAFGFDDQCAGFLGALLEESLSSWRSGGDPLFEPRRSELGVPRMPRSRASTSSTTAGADSCCLRRRFFRTIFRMIRGRVCRGFLRRRGIARNRLGIVVRRAAVLRTVIAALCFVGR